MGRNHFLGLYLIIFLGRQQNSNIAILQIIITCQPLPPFMTEQLFLPPWVTAFCCFVMAALVFFAGNNYGPGLTYDSINYIYAGYSLYEKGTLMRPFQSPYIEWPPLYPAIIAALSHLPGNLLQSIFYFQILIASVTTALSCKLAKRMIRHRLLQITVYISLTFSTPLVLVNHFVWSESFFTLLVVLHILLFIQYTEQPGKVEWILLVITGIMLCMQRQVGAFFIAGGACILLLYPQSSPLSRRVIASLLYVLLAAVVPLMLWWIRNYRLQGLIMNDYRDSLFITPLTEHWTGYNHIFTSLFLPDEMNVWLRICSLYGIIIFLSLFYSRTRKTWNQQHAVLLILIYSFSSYFVFVFLASLAVGEFIDDRIIAPVYIPGIVLFFSLLDRYLLLMKSQRKIWVMYACLLWTLYPVMRTMYNVYVWHSTPIQPIFQQPTEEAFKEKLRFNE
jgi:4-amino-4-deoxy-L-arabinose transferase-like glycosyltransferase